jgi:hypothetical protein
MDQVTASEHDTTGSVRAPVRALLGHIVDYAGLFPPAKLDMKPTVANYATHLAGPHEWMLDRLIVPVARFEEFEDAAAGVLPGGADDDPWHVSALTRPAGDDALAEDLAAILRFNRKHADAEAGRAVVDAIELRADGVEAIDRALDRMPDELFPFFELPAGADPRGMIAALAGADAAAKIRTGGVTPDLFPTPDEVAQFIVACAAAQVPFKATAGLHHPVRHVDASVGTEAFGFLNVFVAAALAFTRERDAAGLLEVLTETSPEAFVFDDAALTWRGERLEADALEDARLAFAVSFGSCSFTEPIEDLQKLGLVH